MHKHLLIGAVLLVVGFVSSSTIAQQAGTVSSNDGYDPTYPANISNMNVWNMYQQYQTMLEEIDKSITKKTPGILSHDATRWLSYVTQLRSEKEYWKTQEFIDLPVTHGRNWVLDNPLDPQCTFKDSSTICQLIALVVNARDELALSASAEIPIHLYPADEARQEAYWAAIEGYLAYLQANSPLDEPVTAAQERLGLTPGDEGQ